MIKRLYFNALSQLSKHYKTDRVAELFLDPPDRILWKKGNLIPMSMPDEQRYVLAIDWAQSVLSESALSELFDGSGARKAPRRKKRSASRSFLSQSSYPLGFIFCQRQLSSHISSRPYLHLNPISFSAREGSA